MPPITRLRLWLAVLVAGLLAVPAAASAGTFDYLKVKGVSQPRFETEKTEIRLPAYDGKQLYIEVTKPKQAGRYPVILEASPYHGTLADREGTRILPDPKDAEGKPLGLTGYFAPRGYAVVMMDLRGTGRSQGCLDHLGPKDARDLEQVVEWAAAQNWSNGRVGMTGHSYVGSTPSVAAAQDPDGLVTIVPSAGLASMYDHQFQGGVPFMLQWAGPQWAYEYLTVARKLPPIGTEPVQGSNTGDDFGSSMEETGCGLPSSALTAGEDQFSGRYSDWHLARDWREGARKADLPVFAVHGVNDNAARISALDWFLRRRDSRDKLWLGQWDHGSGVGPTRRGLQWTGALHAWFDRHLQRRKVATGPQIESFLADTSSFADARGGARTEVVTDEALPLNDKRMTFHPTADGKLSTSPQPDGSTSFTGTPEGFGEFAASDPTWRTGVSFATNPVKRDYVFNGLPDLRLTASVTAPRVHLIANLLDEDPEGTRRRISQFALNPELRDGIAQRSTVTPGERYVMEPDNGYVMAHRLRRGHRLVLQVTTSDPDKVPMFAADPQVTVFTGGEDGTRVSLPVATKFVSTPDDVRLEPAQNVPAGPAQAPVEGTVTTAAPGLGVRIGGVTSGYLEFELLPGRDNAKMEGVATPSTPADLDLYLERQADDGSWTAAGAGDNSGSTESERITTGRLVPGRYRLDVHNWAGAPGTEAAVKLTFFDAKGRAGV